MKKHTLEKINNIHFLFFDGKLRKEAIIFFRVGVGLFLLLHFLSVQKDFNVLYGENSLIPSDIQSVYIKNVFLFNRIIEKINIITNNTENSLLIFKISYITCCITIVFGFFSRIFALILLFLQVGLIKSSYYFAYGADYFSSMSLLYIILFPSDKYFSLRNLFWNYKSNQSDSPFLKLLKIHLNIIYLVSGIEKISGYNWRNGESIWKSIHLPNFSNDFGINVNHFGNFPIVFVAIGWGTIIIELLYPVFININKTKKIWLVATISLHISIAAFLNLYFFSTLMVIWNITAYYFDINLKKNDAHQLN